MTQWPFVILFNFTPRNLSPYIFLIFIYLAALGLSCGMQDLLLWHLGSVVELSHMWDLSSLIKDETHIPCIGRQILNHWITRQSKCITFSSHCLLFHSFLLNCSIFPVQHKSNLEAIILSSRSFMHSSASVILLLISSSVLFISVWFKVLLDLW